MNEQKEKRADRRECHERIEFIVDADIIDATASNESSTGISFETGNPIKIVMRTFYEDGSQHDRNAELAWAKREPDGKTTYGLEYTRDD